MCREIRSRHPEVACLTLTAFGDDEALFNAIMAGAAGYVLKQIRGTDLVGAVRTVASGASMLEPDAASSWEWNAAHRPPPTHPASLTRARIRKPRTVSASSVRGEFLGLFTQADPAPEVTFSSPIDELLRPEMRGQLLHAVREASDVIRSCTRSHLSTSPLTRIHLSMKATPRPRAAKPERFRCRAPRLLLTRSFGSWRALALPFMRKSGTQCTDTRRERSSAWPVPTTRE